jgi:Head domain of trimeric autotransporter adhesin
VRTQIPGSQVLDESIDTEDINDLAVTDDKLSITGVGAGAYTKVTVNTKGRVTAGSRPATLTDAGLSVNLTDLVDVDTVAPILDDVLTWDGTKWVNQTPASIDSLLHLYSENSQSPIDAVALGFNSVAIGSGSEAGASNSIAIGDQALTRITGATNQANGRFASQGDAQTGKYLLRSHTVNGNFTEVFLDGTSGSQRLVLSDDSTWLFKASIMGHQQDGNGHAGFKVEGVIYKVGAVNTFMLGATSKSTIAAHSGWDCDVVADDTNGSLKITVKGEAGKIIRWLAIIETVEVTN